jgi:hypothetical protein
MLCSDLAVFLSSSLEEAQCFAKNLRQLPKYHPQQQTSGFDWLSTTILEFRDGKPVTQEDVRNEHVTKREFAARRRRTNDAPPT